MAKRILFIVFCVNWMISFGQYTYHYDTLSIEDRMLGEVDSVDVLSGVLPTTFDGGIALLSPQGFSISRLNNDFGSFRFDPTPVQRQMKFSGLPFIGFSYSFGGQGTQFVRAEYVQSFTDSLILNVDYTGNIGTGFLRNSTFRSNRINLGLEWKSRWYTLQFNGNYYTDSLDHNGGIIQSDSAKINQFGLEFVSVNKANAASKNVYGNAALTNYFHFDADAVNRLGVLTKHQYDIRYRAYHEDSDTLQSIYSLTNYDTTTTYDRVNLARIQNYAGVFFARENKYVDFKLGHTYWSNLNLGNDFDTTELDFSSELRWDFEPISLKNSLKQNIYGGFGALSEQASIAYQANKWNIAGDLSIERQPPLPFQRSYFANNYDFRLDEINLENRLQLGGRLSYNINDSLMVGASLQSLTIRNAYIFEDTIWNQTGSLDALQIGAFGQFTFGKFNVHPRVMYSIEANSYLPSLQANVRAYFKSRIFKAKKLLLMIGVDGSYVSAFQPRNYIPSMDAYTWNTVSSTSGMANAHFFTTIEISTFRFFVRYENIGYFWNDKTNEEYVGYPIAGQRIRMGLAWSFFN